MSLIKLPPYDKAGLLRFFAEESLLENNPYAPLSRFFHRPPIGEALMHRMKPTVEVFVGHSLYPCSSFIRQHDHGSELKAHYDRRGMEYTVSITVEQDFEDWCLETFEDGAWTPNHTKEEWGALMRGTRTPHRRAPYPGERAIIMTLSYTTLEEFNGDHQGSQSPRHIVLPDALSPAEISRIYREFDPSLLTPGFISENDVSTSDRANSIARLPKEEWAWLSDLLTEKAQWVNSLGWHSDISGGMVDLLQFTRYDEGHWYPWHTDSNRSVDRLKNRTLSCSITLQDAKAGGGLEILGDGVVEAEVGDMVLFPSSQQHRAHMVQRGTRDAIVMWLSKGADR